MAIDSEVSGLFGGWREGMMMVDGTGKRRRRHEARGLSVSPTNNRYRYAALCGPGPSTRSFSAC
jgi:hypothetical protein